MNLPATRRKNQGYTKKRERRDISLLSRFYRRTRVPLYETVFICLRKVQDSARPFSLSSPSSRMTGKPMRNRW